MSTTRTALTLALAASLLAPFAPAQTPPRRPAGAPAVRRGPAAPRRGPPAQPNATPAGAPTGSAATAPREPSPTDVIDPSGFTLRPADRATVRIIAVRGMTSRIVRGRSGSTRLVAIPLSSHGSGIVVRPDGVVLTARHVVQGADVLAVVFPGQRAAAAAKVLYSDPDHDIAFVQIQAARPVATTVALPEAPQALASGQRIAVTGYPIDARERYPAAAAGELSRVNNDGRIQLSAAVNPGNSGGPVLDAEGRLLGVVSERGEPEAGVAGITLVEPIRFAIEAWQREVRTLPAPTFNGDDARVAQSLFDLMRIDPDREPHDPASAQRALALSNASMSPEQTCVVAAQAWNEALVALEGARAADLPALPAERREQVTSLVREALDLHRRALNEAPYLRAHYGFAHTLARIQGSLVAPDPAPLREAQQQDD